MEMDQEIHDLCPYVNDSFEKRQANQKTVLKQIYNIFTSDVVFQYVLLLSFRNRYSLWLFLFVYYHIIDQLFHLLVNGFIL